jgi:phage head maturation protease
MTPPAVETDGRYYRARLVRFGTATIVEPTRDGGWVAFDERWDADSFVTPERLPMRLLTEHHRTEPVGWVESIDTEADGVYGQGHLVGGTEALAHLRALAAEGLRSDISVGFVADRRRDVWSRPTRTNGLASVLRRGARIAEVSIVTAGAIPGAELLAITTRAPGLSPAARAALAAVPAPTPAVLAARVARQVHDARAQGRPPAPPTEAQVIAEAERLIAAGARWHDATTTGAPSRAATWATTGATRTPVLATRRRAAPADWQSRWVALVEREPDAADWHARKAWESELLALLAEPHD